MLIVKFFLTSVSSDVRKNVNCKIWDAWNCGPYDLVTKECGYGSYCGDSLCSVLEDNDDWLSIAYDGITEADFAPKEIIICFPQ